MPPPLRHPSTTTTRCPSPPGSSGGPGDGPTLPFGLTFQRLLYFLIGGGALWMTYNWYQDRNDPVRKAQRAGGRCGSGRGRGGRVQ